MLSFDITLFLQKYFSEDEKIVLGCSTGADSMFLLYHILQTPYKHNLVACYFNHNTRPECKEEEDFLVELGRKEGFSVEIAECDFKKIQKLYPGKGFEELAREKRYQFFEAICYDYKTDKVLVAHHLDDKIETAIFNMLRGTKLSGLVNMQEVSGGILRPLLGIEKKDIYTYLHDHDLQYFEDSSNTHSDHTRNYLRNEVLPLFDSIHPEHKKNLSNLFLYFQELQDYLNSEVQVFLSDEKYFYISEFQELSPLLQKEVIRHIYYTSNSGSTIGLTESNIAEVLKFINGKNNKTKKEIRKMNLFKDGDRILF